MIYSVPAERGYTYYDGPGTFPATGRYRKPNGVTRWSMYVPEAFMEPVPAGSHIVGRGMQARGVIARDVTGALGEVMHGVKRWGWALAVGIGLGWLVARKK